MVKQVVEHGGIPVGVALPENGALRFMAVKFEAFALDGKVFATVAEIKRALGARAAR